MFLFHMSVAWWLYIEWVTLLVKEYNRVLNNALHFVIILATKQKDLHQQHTHTHTHTPSWMAVASL